MPDNSQPSYHLNSSLGDGNFLLEDYKLKVEPLVMEFIGIYAFRWTVTGTGTFTAVDASGLATALGNTTSTFRVSGQDFAVRGPNNVEELHIYAAQCADGGPFVTFERGLGSTALTRSFSFTLVATTTANAPGTENTAVGPDGMVTYTRKGEIIGSGATTAFLNDRMPDFQALFGPPQWVVTFTYESTGVNDSHVTYSMQATELSSPLPVPTPQGGVPVDGEVTSSVERDEQHRVVTTMRYDLLFYRDADPLQAVNALRPVSGPGAGAAVITRERVEVSYIHGLRLRAEFCMLAAADTTTSLADWRQSFRSTPSDPTWDVKEYFGADPVLVQRPKTIKRLVQEGALIGIGKKLKPPDPVHPELMLEKPEVSYAQVNDNEFATQWTYTMAAITPGKPASGSDPAVPPGDLVTLLTALNRPTTTVEATSI